MTTGYYSGMHRFNNVTAAHKKAVSEMSTVEEVLGYNYTAGYPEVLMMNV